MGNRQVVIPRPTTNSVKEGLNIVFPESSKPSNPLLVWVPQKRATRTFIETVLVQPTDQPVSHMLPHGFSPYQFPCFQIQTIQDKDNRLREAEPSQGHDWHKIILTGNATDVDEPTICCRLKSPSELPRIIDYKGTKVGLELAGVCISGENVIVVGKEGVFPTGLVEEQDIVTMANSETVVHTTNTFANCLHRLFLEQTGVRIRHASVQPLVASEYIDKGKHHLVLFFTCSAMTSELGPKKLTSDGVIPYNTHVASVKLLDLWIDFGYKKIILEPCLQLVLEATVARIFEEHAQLKEWRSAIAEYIGNTLVDWPLFYFLCLSQYNQVSNETNNKNFLLDHGPKMIEAARIAHDKIGCLSKTRVEDFRYKIFRKPHINKHGTTSPGYFKKTCFGTDLILPSIDYAESELSELTTDKDTYLIVEFPIEMCQGETYNNVLVFYTLFDHQPLGLKITTLGYTIVAWYTDYFQAV